MGLVCKANKLMRRLLCIGWILPLERLITRSNVIRT